MFFLHFFFFLKYLNPKNKEIKIINKDTGEEINNIHIKKDPISGKEIIIKEESKEKEIISIKDPNTGKEVLIDKETGEKYNNIEKKKDPITGEIKIINKVTGEEIKEIEVKKDLLTGEEIISYKNDIKNDKPKEKEIISIKDSKTGKEKLIDKNTGNELTNIEKKD